MNESDVNEWFEDVAKRNKSIQHTEEKSRFASNVDELSEGIAKKITCEQFTLVLDEPLGKLIDKETNDFMDLKTSSFMILKHCKENDWTTEQTIYDEAKGILMKVVSKMLKERKDRYSSGPHSVMQYYQTDSLVYRKEIILDHNLVGIHASFQFLIPCNDALIYDENDWL